MAHEYAILTVERYWLELKFDTSLQTSSLMQEDVFRLYPADTFDPNATSPEIEDAFRSIDLSADYDSISRTLKLHFASSIIESLSGEYILRIDGLRSASGAPLSTGTLAFKYEYLWDNEPLTPPGPQEPLIEDFSIKKEAILSTETINAANPDFYITKTDPDNNEIFVENDYNRGRIVITFSDRPKLVYVNQQYIKVQRKKISTTVSRWERVEDVQLSLDSNYPRLYISFPSLGDGEAVYGALNEDYFESGYKYRVRLSGDIAT